MNDAPPDRQLPNRQLPGGDLSRRDFLERSASAAGVFAASGCATMPAGALDAPIPAAGAEGSGAATAKPAIAISLNTSTLRGFKLAITETIDIAARAGYAGIEPWPNELDDYVKAGGDLGDLRKLLDDKGLAVTGAIAFFQWIVDDPAARAQGLEEAKRLLERLTTIGATHVAAPPSGPREAVESVDLLAAAERYHDLLVVSEEFPVIPAVEVWGFRERTLKRLGQAVMVALEAKHPRACVLPDVYHLYKGGSGLDAIALLSGKLLGGFHLNDYPAAPPRAEIQDRHRVHCGDGVAPLEKLFRDLRQIGYRGAMSIELFNPEYWKQDPFEVAKTSLEKTRRVIDKAFA